MNTKIKTVLGIVIFAIFLGGAYYAYTNLATKYKLDNQIQSEEEKIKKDSDNEKVPAPDFTVLDIDGNRVKLSDYFGMPIVLNFWASWCPPCKSEMPHFDKVYKDVKDEVTFLMIDLVDGQRETLQDGKNYVEKNGFSFPVYFDTEQEAASIYGISSIPSTLFIDKDGDIVTGYQGAIDEKTLLDSINLIK